MRDFIWRMGYMYRLHVAGRFHSWSLHRKIMKGTAPHGRTAPK